MAEAEILEANLASKQDLKDLETRLLGEIERLRRDMKDLEYRMTIKLGSLMVIAVGSTAALVKLL